MSILGNSKLVARFRYERVYAGGWNADGSAVGAVQQSSAVQFSKPIYLPIEGLRRRVKSLTAVGSDP